jgi:rhodanese-related sulfurtransferase
MRKKLVIEIAAVIAAATFLGFAANFINPNGVKITINRPEKRAAKDTVFLQNSGETNEAVVISKQQLKELISSGIILIDTRSPQEFLQERITNAINVPFEMLDDYISTIDSLPKTSWIVTYCDGPPCDKARLLAMNLADMGFHVAYYDAGLDDWKKTEDVER